MNNLTELEHAIDREQGRGGGGEGSYILQEAVVGMVEPLIHFIARNGKIIAASCSLDRKQSSDLFVTGRNHDLQMTDTISCRSLEEISPLLDIVRRVIELTNYNGLGCFNFKFAARKMTQEQLDEYLLLIPKVPHAQLSDSITTDFGPEGLRHQFSHYDAIPKLFDFNTRMCGSHARQQTIEMYNMLKMYISEVAYERG